VFGAVVATAEPAAAFVPLAASQVLNATTSNINKINDPTDGFVGNEFFKRPTPV
jgi:hypothetical protein